MKSVLIIGMGRFGRHMAQKLYDLGHDVLAIDKNEEKSTKSFLMSQTLKSEILPTKALLTH